MKIALFCNEYPPRPHGGIGTFTQTLACALAAEGHPTRVVEFGLSAGEREQDGVRVVTLRAARLRRGAWLADRLRLASYADAEVRRGTFDLFELPEHGGPLPFRTRYCPTVLRLHLATVSIAKFERQRLPRSAVWVERQTLRKNRNWIGVSRFVLQLTRDDFGIEPHRSTVIYNPVPELTARPPAPSDAPFPQNYVLFVGTLSQRKGVITLARAAKLFLPHYPELKLVFLGADVDVAGRPSREAILAEVPPALHERLLFPGRRPSGEVWHWISGARLVASPSSLEAFSIVPLEVMRCGVPIVYSAEAFGPEAVTDGVTGLLADPRSPEDVSRCVRRLLDDPAFAARLAAAGRAEVDRRFTTATCVANSLGFYDQVLSAGIRQRRGALRAPDFEEQS